MPQQLIIIYTNNNYFANLINGEKSTCTMQLQCECEY